MYTAAILEPMSADLLKWIVKGTLDIEDQSFQFCTDAGMALPHHMTINLGRFDHKLNDPLMDECAAHLFVSTFYFSPELGVLAAKVDKAVAQVPNENGDDMIWSDIRTINDTESQKHITVALRKGVSPKESNRMFSEGKGLEFRLDKTYRLEACVSEVG